MGSMSELWNEQQIQILVLLSFMLQVFLFFAGSIRHRSSNIFLRLFLWISYLAADSVAVYILGLLSRQQDAALSGGRLSNIHPLAVIWAPFLLIHLGGQDTITAFAIEDNNLWLRHFLNLVVQIVLALYVFWKATVWRNVRLLITEIFLFLAGMVKYGERITALKYGTLQSVDDNKLRLQKLPFDLMIRLGTSIDVPESYSHVVRAALTSVAGVRDFFGGCSILLMINAHKHDLILGSNLSLKLLEVELKLIYDDLYTKAPILRTRTGIIVRYISQVSIVVALVCFFTISDKQRYSKVDVAITYTLLLGGIILEVCAAFLTVMSAWTWRWLEARNYRWLARVSWWLLSRTTVALPEKSTPWSNSIGQYDLLSYAGHYDGKPISWKQRMMKTIRATVNFVGVGKGTLFWFSKLLDTTDVTVDKEIMEFISQGVHRYHSTSGESFAQQYFRCLSPVISEFENHFDFDFGVGVLVLHTFTEVHLSKYDTADANPAIEVCRKLSNYIFYLFITHPKMLPASGSTEATLETFFEIIVTTDGSSNINGNNGSDILISKANEVLQRECNIPEIEQCTEESLKEIIEIWIRLIMYVAGKSRPEMHAARLAKGGELLTFVWLLMLHNGLGDLGFKRIELSERRGGDNVAYVYHVDAA